MSKTEKRALRQKALRVLMEAAMEARRFADATDGGGRTNAQVVRLCLQFAPVHPLYQPDAEARAAILDAYFSARADQMPAFMPA